MNFYGNFEAIYNVRKLFSSSDDYSTIIYKAINEQHFSLEMFPNTKQ